MKFLFTFIFSLFFTGISFYAQTNEFNFQKVNIEIEGEKVYSVSAIAQDQQGYIWMLSNLGVIKYNGIEAKTYRDDSHIPGDNNQALYVDSKGIPWVGSISILRKYNPDCDCFDKFPPIDYHSALTDIIAITEDQNKNIWIGTRNGGLFQYDKENNSFTQLLYKPSDPISLDNKSIDHLIVDRNNNLWIGTNSGLICFSISSGNVTQILHDPTNPNSLVDNRISALYEDQKGQILIGTYKSGFHLYNPTSALLSRINIDENKPNQIHAPYSKESYRSKDPQVNLIYQGKNGDYWIGTTGKGINYFNTKTNTFKNYDLNLISPQTLSAICEDRQGTLWIGGAMGSGLFKKDLFALKYHLNTNFMNAEAAYESSLNPGILWIETVGHGLGKMNLQTNEINYYLHNKDNTKSIGHSVVRSIYQENESTLWVGLGNGDVLTQAGDGGIDRMNIETGVFTHFRLTIDDEGLDKLSYTPYGICEDKEGYLWLSAGPGGLFRSDKEKKTFKRFKILEGNQLSDDLVINKVLIDSNGDLWASDFKDDGTLYLYDRQRDKFNQFLKGFKMVNLIVDEKGWFLISTWGKGLIRLNPLDKSYIQYTKKDGLPSNDGLYITKGDQGIYWVNTKVGPAKFDIKTGEISAVGLPKAYYHTGIMLASDDQLYVGGVNGLYSFHPSQVQGNPNPPQVTISDLLISEENFLINKNEYDALNFMHNQNDISFKYIGLHYSNPEKNSYQYKLAPLDDEWINAGNERAVRFANLASGTYNFQVKASNSDGVWSDKTKSIQFTIKPPWWTTWWAYLIYAGIAVAIADRFYRFQLSKKLAISESNNLREVSQLKNSLYTNITHEFRTPLTVIKGMTDAIKSDLQNKKPEGVQNSLEMIERNSNNLLHLVNEMLDLSKIESGNMELQLVQSNVIPFIKYLGESFSSFAQENEINLTIYSEIDSLLMDFDGKKLTSILANLLSNAIKFTEEQGKIIVHINKINQKDQSYLSIKIKDNGIGIASHELPNIFNRFYQVDASTVRKNEGTGIGLALTKELVELMNGTIKVKSTLGKGTEFSVRIPVTNNASTTSQVSHSLDSTFPIIKTKSKKVSVNTETTNELPLVLIIEDNMDVAHYLKTCLGKTYNTIHAANGIDGITMAFESVPDIIISDVMMPGKDGFEVCKTLKNDERSDHIPIIILTAKATFEDKLKGLSIGADAYLAKPFNKEELFTRLDQLILVRKKLINKLGKGGFSSLLNEELEHPQTKFLKHIIESIHNHLDDANFGATQLAKELSLSESQIYRKLKAITDKSTAIFIRSVRLEKAKELLQTTSKSVSEIAYAVGFNDTSWFSRAYKEEFGHPPSEETKN
ncbi:ATP-binding protein [Aurantibacter sp.]|uniref:ATP-binding protein n=1 Tax=Aurantibacter sp. TaxID=2807103 RepID=UPI0032670A3E